MTLNTSVKHSGIILISAPKIYVILVTISIAFEDLGLSRIVSSIFVRAEIRLAVEYDITRRDFRHVAPMVPVALMFTISYLFYLVGIWS